MLGRQPTPQEWDRSEHRRQLAERMFKLFAGRTDVFGSDDGGCVKHTLSPSVMLRHLDGNQGIGVYPLMDDNTVWWGCVDFDEGDEPSLVHATNLEAVLAKFNINAWCERSRSKGWHVWVFLDEPIEADLVRYALITACQIANAPTKEVNPKQTDVSLLGQGYGNYVRVPYKGWLQDSGMIRQVVYVDEEPLSLSAFLDAALIGATSRRPLAKLAALYQPPKPVQQRTWAPAVDTSSDVHRRMGGLAYTIWKDGGLADETGHVDRSRTLYKLAAQLRADGKHTFDEAVGLVAELDQRLGKFTDRADGQQRLVETVERAWSR